MRGKELTQILAAKLKLTGLTCPGRWFPSGWHVSG